MSELETLLENHTESKYELNKEEVIDYIKNNESVLNETITFVNRLTKVVNKIILEDPKFFDIDSLKKIVLFHKEGIILTKQKNKECNDITLLRIESYFNFDVGRISELCFNETKDISWMKKSFDFYFLSAKCYCFFPFNSMKRIDEKHSAYSYLFAGNVAKNIQKNQKNKKYAIKGIKCYNKFLDYTDSTHFEEEAELSYDIRKKKNFLKKIKKQR